MVDDDVELVSLLNFYLRSDGSPWKVSDDVRVQDFLRGDTTPKGLQVGDPTAPAQRRVGEPAAKTR